MMGIEERVFASLTSISPASLVLSDNFYIRGNLHPRTVRSRQQEGLVAEKSIIGPRAKTPRVGLPGRSGGISEGSRTLKVHRENLVLIMMPRASYLEPK